MNRRLYFFCLAAVLALSLSADYAYARNGNEGGGGSEQKEESGSESRESSEDKGSKDESGSGKEDPGSGKEKDDKEDKGAGKGEDKGGGAPDAGKGNAKAPKDQDHARRVVEANEAIPLKDMLEIFGRYGELTVVDVALVERQDLLAYRFKFIDVEGRVRQAYFDARTGQQIR